MGCSFTCCRVKLCCGTQKDSDDVEINGTGFLKAFVRSACSRTGTTHLILYENSPKAFRQNIPLSKESITVHDVASDPLGWKSESHLTLDTDIFKHVTEYHHGSSDTLVIDSLSSLILHRSSAYTCQVLNKFLQAKQRTGVGFSQIICLVHKDLHDEQALNLLYYTASSVLTLTPTKSRDFTGACSILHKKSSGKIVRSKELFRIGPGYEVEEVQPVTDIKLQYGPDKSAQLDPTASLTFNLSLSESERQARSKVHLPYVKQKPRIESHSGVEGKIFYQPDEADDFDEEDPDDDLDI